MGMNALEARRRVLLAQPHEAVASGAIASFRTDIVSALPMEFDLNPIQDLHGQANPYPPGGGKNKVLVSNETLAKPSYYSGTWEGTTVATGENAITVTRSSSAGGFGGVVILDTLPAGDYVFSCTFPATTSNKVFFYGYELNGEFAGQITLGNASASSTSASFRITLPSGAEKPYLKMTAGNNADVPITFSNIQLEAGTVKTDYAPYSNLCPITGHDGFTRTGTGVNVFGGMPLAEAIHDATTYDASDIDTVNKIVTFTRGKQQSGNYINVLFDKFKPNKQYTVIITAKLMGGSGTQNNSLIIRYSNNTVKQVPITSTDKTTYVITSDSGKSVDWFELNYYSNRVCDVYYEESGIFEGVLTADQFAAYSGHSYSTTFPTPPGTVYGGHIRDNGDGTVKLAVNTVIMDLGNATWTDGTSAISGMFYTNKSYMPEIPKLYGNLVCSEYIGTKKSWRNLNNGECTIDNSQEAPILRIRNDDFNGKTPQQVKTALSGVQLVYELYEPIVYTISLDIIRTLIGQNNIWVDNADSVNVEYWGH